MVKRELTDQIGHELSKKLEKHGFGDLYDHGKSDTQNQSIGRINSWFGEKDSSKTRLALIDIAIVQKNSNRVRTLIEIEETSSNPKSILADVLRTLLGEHVTI